MSISVLPYRLGSPASLWQRLIAALRAPFRAQSGRGEGGVNSEVVHDIALRTEHQDYASFGRSAYGSHQRLHARAKWIAAGLPDERVG